MKSLSCFYFLLLITFSTVAGQFDLFDEAGKIGLKDKSGKILIPAQYEALGWSNGSFSIIDRVTGYKAKGQWGLINIDNRHVTKPHYTGVVPGEGLLLIAYKNLTASTRSLAGCINIAGKEIIPFQYDGLKVSSFRVVAYKKSGNQYQCGLLDLNNRPLIPMDYKAIRSIGSLRFAVENFNNKTALFAETGKKITDFIMDSISTFKKDYAIIYQNFQQGLIDRDGQIKIEPKYRAIEIQDNGIANVRQMDEWLFLDDKNQILDNLRSDSITALDKNIYKLTVAGVSRLTDAHFKPISDQTFSLLQDFRNEKAVFTYKNKCGIIHKNGSVVLEPKFQKLIIDKNYYLGCLNGEGKDQWFLLDTVGNKKHTKFYDKIEAFNGEFFPVRKNNHYGAINTEGKEIVACVHDSLLNSKADNIVVKFHGQYGIIDINENWLVAPQPYPLQLVNHSLYLEITKPTTFLKSIDRSTIYFTNNKLEVYPDYLLEYFSSGAIFKIDFQGRIISRLIQTDEGVNKVFPESEGFRKIKKDNKFGFIDSRGRLRIANRYDDAQSLSDGLAAIKILGKWGFVNREDRIAIQPVYDEVMPFHKGTAIVRQKNLYGAVDKTGKLVLQIRYQLIKVLPSNRLLIKIDDLFGLADVSGKIILNPKFNSIDDLNNGYIIVKRNNKYSLLNAQGLSIIPMIYDYLSFNTFNQQYIAMKKSEWEILKFNTQ